ncbi:MAG TPA: response regulator [Candidatus Dormibacteraeota bacterium]|jgi:CheY-like chemotaxis protein|nr:response regulator [Candidatus Dormibacteraeota bacterium]
MPATKKKQMTILLVDDDYPNLELYRLAFSMHGHKVLTAASGADALEVFAEEKPDAVLVDLILGDMVGTELIERMRHVYDGARFFLLSEADPAVLAGAAQRSGVVGFPKLGVPVGQVVRTITDSATIIHAG